MLNLILAALALAIVAAFVCRVDHTLWRREPALQAVNAAGGIAALWVLTEAGQGMAAASEAVLLALALATLLMTYRFVPKRPPQPQRVPRPVHIDDMPRVAGGKK
jgi:hypothetical protein